MCLSLVGCGGGGGGGSTGSLSTGTTAMNPTTPAIAGTLTGTAAKGAALVNAPVSVIDSTGQTTQTQTGADGSYSCNLPRLSPPYLIRVRDGSTDYFGIAFTPGIANITPLSHLILDAYFRSQGTTTDAALRNPTGVTLPSEGSIERIRDAVMTNLQEVMNQQGLDFETFDPLHTRFEANHQGFDGLLDRMLFQGGSQFQINNGTVTLTVTLQPQTGGIVGTTCRHHNNNTGADTTEHFETHVGQGPTFGNLDPAVTGINEMLARLTDTINTRGAQLADTDILTYMTADFNDDGTDRATFATTFAAEFNGVALRSMKVAHVMEFHPGSPFINVKYAVTRADDPNPYFKRMVFQRQADGSWLMRGNQERVEASDLVHFENARFIDNATDSGFNPTAVIDMRAPQNLLTSVKVSDPSNKYFSAGGTTIPKLAQADFTLLLPHDMYYATHSDVAFPSVDVLFGVEIGFLGMPAQTIPARVRATTTDTIGSYTIQVNNAALPSHQLSSLGGGPTTLSWTAPSTFQFSKARVVATLRSAHYSRDHIVLLPPGVNQISFPAPISQIQPPIGQPGGPEAVTDVIYRVEVHGPAGETVSITDHFN